MIARILGWFGALFIKRGIQMFFISTQLSIVIFFLTSLLASVLAFSYAYFWVYNQVIGLLTYLQNIGGDTVMSQVLYGLECTGIKSAYENGINLLWVALSFRVALIVKSYIVNTVLRISNELFKLGTLIGQW